MNKIKKGDIVGRKSHEKDILFVVERIISNSKDQKIAILKGLTIRIAADSPIEDLELIDKRTVAKNKEKFENSLNSRINNIKNKIISNKNRIKTNIILGRILHLDGDKKYTEKSLRYYKKIGLNAIVKYVPENKQPDVVFGLLQRYNPDILVITGHDGMIKNETKYNDIYNYRNSKYFIETVKQARKWDKNFKLVIFAGACQSYFEALINAGANFASSPARVLIDFSDPLIVAEKVAITDEYKFLTIDDIAYELRDGKDGIGGVGANGKKRIVTIT